MKPLSAILFAGVLVFAPHANAQMNVFLDFSNFEMRLDQATGSAGVPDFTAGEITQIENNVIASLNTLFDGFSITFTTTNPGGTFETLDFGEPGGGYGLADEIDFGNVTQNNTGRIFTANFDDFLEAGDPRATQIMEISTSLAGTAGHELGHNLGLEHRDPYGMASFPASNASGGFNTGGLHNQNVMGTGITGLSEAEREVQRNLSDLSRVKLNFAQGAVLNPLTIGAETGTNNNTAANAQQVNLESLDVQGGGYEQAAAFLGDISSSADIDYYSFDLVEGEKITIQAMSQVIEQGFNNLDSILTIYDVDGTTTLVSNDDTTIDGNSVNPGGSFYSADAAIYNFEALATGTYFVSIEGFGSDTGDYYLLFAATQSIPEPSSGLIIATALGLAVLRRRRR